MARIPSTQPTELEVQVLRFLWSNGDSTVRQVHNRLVELRGDNYAHASTVKMLSVMLDKGLVSKDDSIRPQMFRAEATEKKTQRSMLKNLVQRAYDGSSATMILQALSDKSITPDEVAKIREMLDRREQQ